MAHRMLVVGVAGRGQCWARMAQAHPEFELQGLMDVNPQILTERGETYRIPPECRHTDLQQALLDGNYDVVAVNTPNHLHYPIARQVIQAGRHCLIEKPFTDELAQAEDLVRLGAVKGVVVQVAQNYRYKPLCRFVAEFIRESRLGATALFRRLHRHTRSENPIRRARIGRSSRNRSRSSASSAAVA